MNSSDATSGHDAGRATPDRIAWSSTGRQPGAEKIALGGRRYFDLRCTRWLSAVNAHVGIMDRYLEGIVMEFQNKYKDIADCQKLYEARVVAVLKALDAAPTSTCVIPGNEPWKQLGTLPEVKDLLECGSQLADGKSRYRSQFVKSLDDASHELRDALLGNM